MKDSFWCHYLNIPANSLHSVVENMVLRLQYVAQNAKWRGNIQGNFWATYWTFIFVRMCTHFKIKKNLIFSKSKRKKNVYPLSLMFTRKNLSSIHDNIYSSECISSSVMNSDSKKDQHWWEKRTKDRLQNLIEAHTHTHTHTQKKTYIKMFKRK